MQISFVMLLFSNQISGGGPTVSGDARLPPVEESQVSIFVRFEELSLTSLCFSIDFVCWLAKNANHNLKTIETQKV